MTAARAAIGLLLLASAGCAGSALRVNPVIPPGRFPPTSAQTVRKYTSPDAAPAERSLVAYLTGPLKQSRGLTWEEEYRARQTAAELGANALIYEQLPGDRWRLQAARIEGSALAAADRARPAPAASDGCTPLRQWQGDGDRTTERFSVPTGDWRIRITGTYGRLGNVGALNILVRDEGGTVVTSGGLNSTGFADTFVHAPAGSYYLEVRAVNMSWSLATSACG